MRKDACERYPALNIIFLKKNGYFSLAGQERGVIWTHNLSCVKTKVHIFSHTETHPLYLHLRYQRVGFETLNDEVSYAIYLTTTPCFFGGKRYWFVCPLIRNGLPCKKRVAVLYGVGKYYGCRHCYRLVYRSQQETHTGWRGFFGKTVFNDLDDRWLDLRVKYWHGKPTKRFRSLLRKMHRSPNPNEENITPRMFFRGSKKELSTVL